MARRAAQPKATAVASDYFTDLIHRGETTGSTGRFLVRFQKGAGDAGMNALRNAVGLRAVSPAGAAAATVSSDQGVHFPNLGLAVLPAEPAQHAAMAAAASVADNGIASYRPERIVYVAGSMFVRGRLQEQASAANAASAADLQAAFYQGYRAALDRVFGLPPNPGPSPYPIGIPSPFMGPLISPMGIQAPTTATTGSQWADNAQSTWGLQAIQADTSSADGRGIKVAVLDTGLDLAHQDFQEGRVIAQQSFVPGVGSVQDGHGHGTHCIGTACGPKFPHTGARYGVACAADIIVGKVLSDDGRSVEGSIFSGLDWALGQGAQVISLSIDIIPPISGRDPHYDQVGRQALQQGCVIVAAAGNSSHRSAGQILAVSPPANSPYILSVGAVDHFGRLADFSRGAVAGTFGKVNVVGPGVDVYSSWPAFGSGHSGPYNTISGTSMATPHAAGVAALIWQVARDKGYTYGAADCLNMLCQLAIFDGLNPTSDADRRDMGTGLIQAAHP